MGAVVAAESEGHPPPERIQEFGRGRLTGPEATSIEEHLSSCDDCARLLVPDGRAGV
jgi:hypothetical protein